MTTPHTITTADLIKTAYDAINHTRNPDQHAREALMTLTEVLSRIPTVTLTLDSRATVNGVGIRISRNWGNKKFSWAIGGVNVKGDVFDTVGEAVSDLKRELSERGLICNLIFNAT